MTREEIISGLQFTVDMFLLDLNTGKTYTEPRNDMDKTTIDACRGAIELLKQEPKTGHWIEKEGREQGYDIVGIKTWYMQIMCDKCGFIKTAIEGHTGQYHYCPNCGAKMESEDKE